MHVDRVTIVIQPSLVPHTRQAASGIIGLGACFCVWVNSNAITLSGLIELAPVYAQIELHSQAHTQHKCMVGSPTADPRHPS